MISPTIRVRNFRVLEQLDWSPEGVCVLSGANGAGKSTTLDALLFLRTLFTRGHETAFRAVDGVAFQRVGAEPDAHAEFVVEIGDIVWKLAFPMSARGLQGTYGEILNRGSENILRAPMFQEEWYLGKERQPLDETRCCARVLWDREAPEWLRPLVDFLEGIRIYSSYWLNQVKRTEPVSSTDSTLHASGRNLWAVLSNWKGAHRRYGGQFDWVLDEARRAFPDLLGDIEFDRGLPYLFRPGVSDPAGGLLPNRAADGLLTGLLHLTAVAGAKDGALIAFDEVENQLHPHAIRSLLAAMRKRADAHNLTIILTTHSPVVLNAFRDEPENVFVLTAKDASSSVPTSMFELHDEDWLAQAKLGTLYERLAFGAPNLGGLDP